MSERKVTTEQEQKLDGYIKAGKLELFDGLLIKSFDNFVADKYPELRENLIIILDEIFEYLEDEV
jgi:hypothetical protein